MIIDPIDFGCTFEDATPLYASFAAIPDLVEARAPATAMPGSSSAANDAIVVSGARAGLKDDREQGFRSPRSSTLR